MNKIARFVVLLTIIVGATLSTACMTMAPQTGVYRQRYLITQASAIVRVVNNCAPKLDIETVEGLMVSGLPYAESHTVILSSTPFSGSNRSMFITVKGYVDAPGGKREYLGSFTREFYVNTQEGSRREAWEVDQLNLPNNRGGCR